MHRATAHAIVPFAPSPCAGGIAPCFLPRLHSWFLGNFDRCLDHTQWSMVQAAYSYPDAFCISRNSVSTSLQPASARSWHVSTVHMYTYTLSLKPGMMRGGNIIPTYAQLDHLTISFTGDINQLYTYMLIVICAIAGLYGVPGTRRRAYTTYDYELRYATYGAGSLCAPYARAN